MTSVQCVQNFPWHFLPIDPTLDRSAIFACKPFCAMRDIAEIGIKNVTYLRENRVFSCCAVYIGMLQGAAGVAGLAGCACTAPGSQRPRRLRNDKGGQWVFHEASVEGLSPCIEGCCTHLQSPKPCYRAYERCLARRFRRLQREKRGVATVCVGQTPCGLHATACVGAQQRFRLTQMHG